MALAARFAQAMLDADSNLLESYVFTLVATGTTDPLTIYADVNKSSVVSADGMAFTDAFGNLLVWTDDVAFDLYIHGMVSSGQLQSGTLVQSALYPIATPGEERQPLLFQFMMPTNPWVLDHGRDYDPLVVCKDTSGRSFSGDVAYAPGIVTVTYAAPQTGTAELT